MTLKPKPMLNGRELRPEELEIIRRDLESFDTIDVATDDMRALIASEWPHLLAKLRPKSSGSR
jgi:hypothetical protein